MRKQTKLVAVLSAAALLAIGASMTSFAGWEKNSAGQWTYTDKDGEAVTSDWKKDGGNWYYLDDDGIMAADQWVDGKYVAADGHMLKNEWMKGYGEDVDDSDIDSEEHWWWFNSKGELTPNKLVKYNGQQYRMDGNGAMISGWWSDGTDLFYFGGEDDGARKAGWLYLAAPEEDAEGDVAAFYSESNADEAWYFFGTGGKAYKATSDKAGKLVNSKRYYFNKFGQMLYEWVDVKGDVATDADADTDTIIATAGQVRYVDVEEIGSNVTGWRKIEDIAAVVGANDVDEHWYYFKKGKAYAAEEGKILKKEVKWDGKKGTFFFDDKGIMKTGFVFTNGAMFYADGDGYMKTGKMTIDGDAYNFTSKNVANGQGVNGAKDGYLYVAGKRVCAEDTYALVTVKGKTYVVNSKGALQKSETKKYAMDEGKDKFFKFSSSEKYVVEKESETKDGTFTDVTAGEEFVVTIDDKNYYLATEDGKWVVKNKAD